MIREPGSPEPLAKAATVVALAAIVLIAGSLSLTRPGYSVDEEFTVFAVRGIQAHGLPILPSGLLYDRGIAYSYAAWLAGAVTGSELPAFRAVSVASAALVVLLTFMLVRRAASEMAALAAAFFVTLSIPFWATATSARFYAPFLGAYLLALYLLTHRHWWIGLIAAAALARLTHELAFTLAVIPVMSWLLAKGDRRNWLVMTASVVAGLALGQLVLLALHYAAPGSGDTMVRRFFLWQVLNLFERPGDRQFLIPIVVLIIGLLIAPKRAWIVTVSSLSVAVLILSMSIARASNSAPLSGALIRAVLVEGSRYPLDMFWHILRLTPLTLVTALSFIVFRRRGEWPTFAKASTSAEATAGWPPRHRAAHLLWIGWTLWFGVIDSGITTNYLLLPISFLLLAIAIDATTVMPRVAVVVLAVVIAADQWRATTLEAARPTILADGLDDVRSGLQANDRVVCTDELGCLMLVGRIDRWLALDDFVRERFLVGRGDGPVTGVYTGVPAVFRPAALFTPFDSTDVARGLAQGRQLDVGTLPDRVVIVDVFKDYPVGNSRSWLPKAIEEDGLRVVPLLETPQLRVLQVSPADQVAYLQP